MALKIITPPAAEPITLEEAKQHLRISGSDDDIILLSMIKQAREFCEDFQNKRYITQVLELVLDSFPADNYIPFKNSSPVQSVESIKYYDTAGEEFIFDQNKYIVDRDSFVNRTVLGYCRLWTTVQLQTAGGVRIRFTAGFGDSGESVPETVKWAMVLHMRLLYDDYRPDERQKIEEARNSLLSMNTFRIRWEGHGVYSTWGTLNLVWELILFNDSAMVLVIEQIPNTGTNSFINSTSGTTTLTLVNSKSYAFISGQEQGKAYTVQEGSYIQANIKYLMVDGNDIKHWDTASLSYVKISELPLTADKFQSYGDDNYHKERTGLISTSPILKIWSPITEIPAPMVTQTIKPKPAIVNMREDILFTEAYIVDIVNAVITLDNTGSGVITFIVSVDSGVSWKTWNGSSWVLVDITNMEDVKTKGMTVTVFQGITEAQWTSLGLSDKKIRFAWYMEITASTNILRLKEIRVNYNTV